MQVEHQVRTALDEATAFETVTWALESRGFRVAEKKPGVLTLRRTRDAPHAGNPAHLPQAARLEYADGRIAVTCSIEQRGKPQIAHRKLMIGLVEGIEMTLVHRLPGDQATARYRDTDRAVSIDWQRARRRRMLLGLGMVMVAVLAIVGLVILLR
jgi:hypothetical protein